MHWKNQNQERMKESREFLAQTRSGIELHVRRSPADALEACRPRQSVERGKFKGPRRAFS